MLDEEAENLMKKGIEFARSQQYSKAIKCYEDSLMLDPYNSFTWFNKGVLLVRMNRLHDALNAFDRALSLDPCDADIWVNKALTCHTLSNAMKRQ